MNELESLILEDRIDDAVEYASDLNLRRVSSLIQGTAMDQAPEKFDHFIRCFYKTLDSAYVKADFIYQFGGFYITKLSYLDDAFFTYRDIALDALKQITVRLNEDISLLETLVNCPDRVVPPSTYDRFVEYGKQIQTMKFSLLDSEMLPHEKIVTDWLAGMGEDPDKWTLLFRSTNKSEPSNCPTNAPEDTPQKRKTFWKRSPK